MAESDPALPTADLVIDGRSAIAIAGAVGALALLAYLIDEVPRTLTALVLASLIALALNPIVLGVQRRTGWGRQGAVAIVLAGAAVVIAVVLLLIVPPAVRQFSDLGKQTPEVVDQLTSLPLIGDTLERNDVPDQIKEWVDELPERLSVDATPVERAALVVADGAFAVALTLLLSVTLLLDGRFLATTARRLVPLALRERADRLGHIGYHVVGRYVAGALFIAACAGTAVLTFGLVLGIPLAPLAGIWVSMTNLIPQVGGALGGIPFVLLGFAKSPTTGVVCAVLFVGYQLFENHVLGPVIQGRAVKLSPPLTMVVVLIGVSAGGVVGALIAVPIAGAVKAFYTELRTPNST